MNTNTAITTAARRIARTVNTSRDLKFAFDAEGREIAATLVENIADWAPEDTRLVLAGRRGDRMTQREAQDHLDAEAYADAEIAAGSAWNRSWLTGYYIENVETDRKASRR